MARTKLAAKGVNPARLTDRQRAFVAEYVTDYNAVRAARAAGYAHPLAAGGKLVKNKLVAAAIGKIQRDNLERLQLTKETIVEKLACVVLRDPIDLCDANGQIVLNDLRKLPKRIRVCIDGIKVRSRTDNDGNISQEVELRFAPTNPAMELALRHFGMLRDRLDVQESQKLVIDYESLYRKPSESVDLVEHALLTLEATTPATIPTNEVNGT
jgi:Terminase small subunit